MQLHVTTKIHLNQLHYNEAGGGIIKIPFNGNDGIVPNKQSKLELCNIVERKLMVN